MAFVKVDTSAHLHCPFPAGSIKADMVWLNTKSMAMTDDRRFDIYADEDAMQIKLVPCMSGKLLSMNGTVCVRLLGLYPWAKGHWAVEMDGKDVLFSRRLKNG